jgi:hypothetical protein
MKKLITIAVILLTLTAILITGQEKQKSPESLYTEINKNDPPNTLSSAEKKDGWKLIFDGKTTKGWHGYNMKVFPDCWEVDHGTLTMNTTGSAESLDIITDKEYKNFALFLEYKLTKAANSGVIYQVAEDPKYKFPYETGPEFQVIDHQNWQGKLEDWQINGANYAMYPPLVQPYKPLGEWNQLFLVVQGNTVTQILNGSVVVRYEKYSDEWKKLRNSGKWSDYPDWGKYDQGYISLQNHGTKVWYRSVKIKEL